MIEAWHFVGETLRDGTPVPADGEWLKIELPIVMCERGFHASERIIDALRYAPCSVICRVECSGVIQTDPDKLVCSERRIVWRIDGESTLREFARLCALDVAHLWDMPSVVRQYLESGDEQLRDAAWDAAWDAGRTAARDAARAAARTAARAAARTAAWDAAWDAGRTAARAAARTAAWAAAWDAARDAQNDQLTAMVLKAAEL